MPIRIRDLKTVALTFICIWLMIFVLYDHVTSHQTTNGIENTMRDAEPEQNQEEEEAKTNLASYTNSGTASTAPMATTSSSQRQLKAGSHPAEKPEVLRRKFETGLLEFWYFIRGEIKKLNSSKQMDSRLVENQLNQFLSDGAEHFRTIWAYNLNLREMGAAKASLQNLTDLMQRRLHKLQNPTDCTTAKKLLCTLHKSCGFGCQLHHVAYCLIVAYGTKRTLILNSSMWRYSKNGWESVFLPLSETCLGHSMSSPPVKWRGDVQNENDSVVSLSDVDVLKSRPEYLPLSFPEDLAEDLIRFHGNPPAWFVGQFLYYLMRYSNQVKRELAEKEEKLKFKGPIVGLHVRRTDKLLREAKFHNIEEYMEWADDWFKISEVKFGRPLQRRVYIATDDENVLREAKLKYQEYEVICDEEVAKEAGNKNKERFTESGLHGIIADIHFLSKCDYIVCTFSSQVCRVAYELMQVSRGDAADWVHSLDDIYYFGGQYPHEQVALFRHKAKRRGELNLEPGDEITVGGNHWDGFSIGTKPTGRTGLYPSYKAQERWRIVKFPTYPEVN